MKRVAVLTLAALALIAGTAKAAPYFPADGEHLVMKAGDAIEAEFQCNPSEGGLSVRQTADFKNEWFSVPGPIVEVEEGVCAVILYQFPTGSAAVDSIPHVYYWRTRQCLYAGNCQDGDARWGSIWSFTIERPPVPAAPNPPLPSTPSPKGVTTPATVPSHTCEEDRRTIRELKRVLGVVQNKRRSGHTSAQGKKLNRRAALLRQKLRIALAAAERHCP